MFNAQVMQVIRTDLELRGNGTPDNPYRRVTQYWTLEGELLAEVDHWRESKDAMEAMTGVTNITRG